MLENINNIQISDYFSRADKILISVKKVTGNEVIPAITQLRYSGSHLVEYLRYEKEEDMIKAKNHAEKAAYEAVRYGAAFCFYWIEEFRKIYSIDILSNEVIEKIKEAKKNLKEISTDKLKENSECNNDEISYLCNRFDKINDIFEDLKDSQNDLNEKAAKKEKEEYRESLKFVLSSLATIIVSLYGIIKIISFFVN